MQCWVNKSYTTEQFLVQIKTTLFIPQLHETFSIDVLSEVNGKRNNLKIEIPLSPLKSIMKVDNLKKNAQLSVICLFRIAKRT